MTNYERLKKIEAEKAELRKEMGEDRFMDIEPDYDLNVKCLSTKQEGYVESYLDSDDICFTVPQEDLTEYRISAEEFNEDFIIKNI